MSRPTSGLFHKVVSLCKRRGFIFEVPGEGERTYDYGPLGAELKSNLINEWYSQSMGISNYAVCLLQYAKLHMHTNNPNTRPILERKISFHCILSSIVSFLL